MWRGLMRGERRRGRSRVGRGKQAAWGKEEERGDEWRDGEGGTRKSG